MSDIINKIISSPVSAAIKIFSRSKTTQETAKVKAQEAVVDAKQVVVSLSYEHLPKYSKNLIKLAGLSGLTAVIMSAYGAHAIRRKNAKNDLKEIYNTAQYFHLVHSVALFGLPLVKRPVIVSYKK